MTKGKADDKLQSREDKITFLKGLVEGTRSVDEIADKSPVWMTYKYDGEKVVITSNGGVLNEEQAIRLLNRTGQRVNIYVAGLSFRPARLLLEDHLEKAVNPKAGPLVTFYRQDGNAPLIDEDNPEPPSDDDY